MSDFQYIAATLAKNEALAKERARWQQVLGATGNRKTAKPAPRSILARIFGR